MGTFSEIGVGSGALMDYEVSWADAGMKMYGV